MNVLVIDVGGTHVKILASGQKVKREMDSGPNLTAEQMVARVRALAQGWKFDAVAIGYPGPVVRNRPVKEPYNLGKGWVDLDFDTAFGCPVRMLNDAAMQALGSYKGGKMLFLGLGTGLGTTLIVDGVVVPMELAHLPYRKATFEDYVGVQAFLRDKKKWCKHVADVVARLAAALVPEDVVLGGGNAVNLKELPPLCRLGDNANAFAGGFRMWEQPAAPKAAPRKAGGPKASRAKSKRPRKSKGR